MTRRREIRRRAPKTTKKKRTGNARKKVKTRQQKKRQNNNKKKENKVARLDSPGCRRRPSAAPPSPAPAARFQKQKSKAKTISTRRPFFPTPPLLSNHPPPTHPLICMPKLRPATLKNKSPHFPFGGNKTDEISIFCWQVVFFFKKKR